MSNIPPPPPARPGSTGPGSGMPDKSGGELRTGELVELAHPGRRLLARIIDILIMGLTFTAFLQVAGVEMDMDEPPGQEEIVASLIVGFLYEGLLIAYLGQTLGKMALRIKVVASDAGGTPGLGRSVLRWGLPAALALVPFAGPVALLVVYLSLLWNPMRQGYHDMLGRTLVIKV